MYLVKRERFSAIPCNQLNNSLTLIKTPEIIRTINKTNMRSFLIFREKINAKGVNIPKNIASVNSFFVKSNTSFSFHSKMEGRNRNNIIEMSMIKTICNIFFIVYKCYSECDSKLRPDLLQRYNKVRGFFSRKLRL